MLIHVTNNCGGMVRSNVSGLLDINSAVFIDRSGRLAIGNLYIKAKSQVIEGGEVEFVCTSCDNSFGVNEIGSYCGYCNRLKSTDEIGTNNESGSPVCTECNKKHFPEAKYVPMSDSIKKLVVSTVG